MQYRVSWEIDVWAETALEAAKEARKIQLREESAATIFNVFDENGHFKASVDLDGDIVTN
jgi:hypothetical protein